MEPIAELSFMKPIMAISAVATLLVTVIIGRDRIVESWQSFLTFCFVALGAVSAVILVEVVFLIVWLLSGGNVIFFVLLIVGLVALGALERLANRE